MLRVFQDASRDLLRALGRTTGKTIINAQRRWRRHVFAADHEKEIRQKHGGWCADFRPPPPAIEVARQFLKDSFNGYDDIRWHEVYWRISANLATSFIPRDLFYLRIEPTLNAMSYVRTLTDKNVHYTLGLAPHLVAAALHVIRGEFYLPDFIRADEDRCYRILHGASEEFVLKPSMEHGGGRRVEIMDGPSTAGSLKALLSNRSSRGSINYLVQKPIAQCTEMARFNPSSINTFRIMTMRIGRTIACLSSVFRVGRAGMRVDNQAAGGLAAGLDGALLRGRAIDRDWAYHETHPDSGASFSGELPGYEAALQLCLTLHPTLPWFDLVSWDVAIDRNYKPKIIEFNTAAQEIDFHQLTNGPLFGNERSTALLELRRRLALMPADPDFARD